jgi:hypothetical protein
MLGDVIGAFEWVRQEDLDNACPGPSSTAVFTWPKTTLEMGQPRGAVQQAMELEQSEGDARAIDRWFIEATAFGGRVDHA